MLVPDELIRADAIDRRREAEHGRGPRRRCRAVRPLVCGAGGCPAKAASALLSRTGAVPLIVAGRSGTVAAGS